MIISRHPNNYLTTDKKNDNLLSCINMYILIYIITLSVVITSIIFPAKILNTFFLIFFICLHIFFVDSKYKKCFCILSTVLICLSTLSVVMFSLNYPNLMPSSSNSMTYNVVFIIVRFIFMYLILCILTKKWQKFSIFSICIILFIGISVIYCGMLIPYFLSIMGINFPIFYSDLNSTQKNFYEPRYCEEDSGRTVRVTTKENLYEVTMYRANYFYHNQNVKLKDFYQGLIEKLSRTNVDEKFFTINEISIAVMHGAKIVDSANPCFVFPTNVTFYDICVAHFMVPNVGPQLNFFEDINRYNPINLKEFKIIGERRAFPFPTRHQPHNETITETMWAVSVSSRCENFRRSSAEEPWMLTSMSKNNRASRDLLHKYDNFLNKHPFVSDFNKGILLNTPATRINEGHQLPTGPAWRNIVNNGLYPFVKSARPWEI